MAEVGGEVGVRVGAEVIDAHHHLWHYNPRDYGWISSEMQVLQRDFAPQDLKLEMRAAGVSGSIAVQARQSLNETRELLRAAEQFPFLRGVVGWLPLCDDDFPTTLTEFRDSTQLKGVRHVIQDEIDDDFILGAQFNRGIAALLDTGLVYDILIHERHLPQAAVFVQRHPQQVFVLDHLAKPRIRDGVLEPWRDNLFRLAECGNVFCKLSGLVTEANWATWTAADLQPYLDAALQAFGPSRLMAGSDWPVCLLASGYSRWWSVVREWAQGLHVAGRAQIFGGTAGKVYRL